MLQFHQFQSNMHQDSAHEAVCLCVQRILSVDYRLPPNKVVSDECKDLLRCRATPALGLWTLLLSLCMKLFLAELVFT